MTRIATAASLAATAACLAVAVPAAAAEGWPLAAHDAERSNRSAVVAAPAPRLLPGWPVASASTDVPLAAIGGEIELRPQFERRRAVIGPDGRWRRYGSRGGTVAIGPDGRRYTFEDEGQVVRAWAADGAPVWVSPSLSLGPAASERDIVPAPDGSVHVDGWLGVAALNGDGSLRWRRDLGMDHRVGALAVGRDGTVFLGEPAALVALTPAGAERWRVPLPGGAALVAGLPDGGVVVVQGRASPAGGAAVRAFSGVDGRERWSLPTGADAAAGLAAGADGAVYAVLTRGTERNGRVAVEGELVAVAPEGTVRWRVAGPWSTGSPVVGGDGTVYVGGSPMAAVRPDGTVRWRLPAQRVFRPRAIGPDGTLYATAQPGTVLALAGPAAARSVVIPGVPSGPLVSGLSLRERTVRLEGPISLCPRPGGPCTPSTPFDTTIQVRLSRDALVSFLVRRAGGREVVGRSDARLTRGTNWWRLRDVVPRGSLRNRPALPPGRYTVQARAAAGSARATTAALSVTVRP